MSRFIEFDEDGEFKARLIEGLHVIPAGAVRVEQELWERTIQETDGIWRIADGVISKHPLELDFDRASAARAWRDTELIRVAWLRDRHRDEVDMLLPTTLTTEQFAELLGYMQSLRDWPLAENFPDDSKRPPIPVFAPP